MVFVRMGGLIAGKVSSAMHPTIEQNVIRYRFFRWKWPDEPTQGCDRLSRKLQYHQVLIRLVIFLLLHQLKKSSEERIRR